MCPLYIRVMDIRDWYYDWMTSRELYTFYSMDLDKEKEYTYEELKGLMDVYVLLLKGEVEA